MLVGPTVTQPLDPIRGRLFALPIHQPSAEATALRKQTPAVSLSNRINSRRSDVYLSGLLECWCRGRCIRFFRTVPETTMAATFLQPRVVSPLLRDHRVSDREPQ
jgi:hypothetical protein